MADIDVVASYDIWRPANETNAKNNGHPTITVDLRKLDLDLLPTDIDVIVGSPPCTQFSFANRGGNGDLGEGMADLEIFLCVIDRLRPRVWAMENVPRMSTILDRELTPGGRLEKFSHLKIEHRIINMEDFGLPQRRKRCIAGNLDFDLLTSYTASCQRRTLGQIVSAMSNHVVEDPIFGMKFASSSLIDHVTEDGLSDEEIRINRANKIHHPIYNKMPFPDPLDRSVRTITATCTRVSRESIVVRDPAIPDTLRRLTIRERASLQGFPIDFQFFGGSYRQKIQMIGNAVPPLFSYYVANALKEVPLDQLSEPDIAKAPINRSASVPKRTAPAGVGAVFPRRRRFRFAIPSLRLSSGVRFELTNAFEGDIPKWKVDFVFGTSKSIHTLALGHDLLGHLRPLCRQLAAVRIALQSLEDLVSDLDVEDLQGTWSRAGKGTDHPFKLLDALDSSGRHLRSVLVEHETAAQTMVVNAVAREHKNSVIELKGVDRLRRNAPVIAAGLLIGSAVNVGLSQEKTPGRANSDPASTLRFGS
jgi:DNA (cytosine-5)-methyltransferase 1